MSGGFAAVFRALISRRPPKMSRMVPKLSSEVPKSLKHVSDMVIPRLMTGPRSFEFGVPLPLPSGPRMLFVKLSNHLGDEAALASALSLKGAAGTKPCALCANIVRKGFGLLAEGTGLQEITCVDEDLLVLHDDDSVCREYDRLQDLAHAGRQADLQRRQKASGFVLNLGSLMGDHRLRRVLPPVSTLTYDWMHTYLSNGVASQEMHAFFDSCRVNGMRDAFALMERFCRARWSFPKQFRKQGFRTHEMFCEARARSSKDHWRSGASELLSAYPLVRHFAETVALPTYPGLLPQVESLRRCCRVVDLLQDAKSSVEDTLPGRLRNAIRTHLEAHRRAFGGEAWKPKMHYALHLPTQIARDRMVLDCFAVERAHLLPKAVSEAIHNTSSFEKSVIARTVGSRLRSLRDADDFEEVRLLEERPASSLAGVLRGRAPYLAAEADFCGLFLSAGDFVFLDGLAMVLSGIGRDDEGFFLLGQLATESRRHSRAAAEWRIEQESSLAFVAGKRVRRAHAWCTQASGLLLVLQPDL